MVRAAMRRSLNTYAAYSLGCALVWTLILALFVRHTDKKTQRDLWVTFGAWASGWLSATIARLVYPPPRSRHPGVILSQRTDRAGALGLLGIAALSLYRLFRAGRARKPVPGAEPGG